MSIRLSYTLDHIQIWHINIFSKKLIHDSIETLKLHMLDTKDSITLLEHELASLAMHGVR